MRAALSLWPLPSPSEHAHKRTHVPPPTNTPSASPFRATTVSRSPPPSRPAPARTGDEKGVFPEQLHVPVLICGDAISVEVTNTLDYY